MQLLNSNLLITYFYPKYEQMSVDVIPFACFVSTQQLVVCNERAYGSDISRPALAGHQSLCPVNRPGLPD